MKIINLEIINKQCRNFRKKRVEMVSNNAIIWVEPHFKRTLHTHVSFIVAVLQVCNIANLNLIVHVFYYC